MFLKSFFCCLFIFSASTFSKDDLKNDTPYSLGFVTGVRTSFEYTSNLAYRVLLGLQMREGRPSEKASYPRTVMNFARDRNAGFFPRTAKTLLDNFLVANVLSSADAFKYPMLTVGIAGAWQWSATIIDSLIIQRTLDVEAWRIGKGELRPYTQIIKSLGFEGLFRGATMNIGSSLTTWTFFLWYTNNFVTPRYSSSYSFYDNARDAFLGSVGEVIMFLPFWNMRTSMQQHMEKSLMEVVAYKWRHQGMKGFYFGWKFSLLYAFSFALLDFRILYLQQNKTPNSRMLAQEPFVN